MMQPTDPARTEVSMWYLGRILLGVVLIGSVLAGCDLFGSEEEEMQQNGTVSFDSGNIGPGGEFSYTFEDEGTFDYYCTIHGADMTGSITVESGASDSGSVAISMENTSYVPQEKTIAPETEVTWTNNDDFAHTVTSGVPDGGDNSGGSY